MAKPSIIQELKEKYGIKNDTLDRTITALAGIIYVNNGIGGFVKTLLCSLFFKHCLKYNKVLQSCKIKLLVCCFLERKDLIL